MKIGGEEVEVSVTKNADGTDNIDFSKARRKNANDEYEEFAITNIDIHYYCKNPNCPAQIKEKIIRFVSKDCMDIE